MLLAPYAIRSTESAGRRHPERPHPYRGPYQRDRDRIVHSSAYRRLSYKTQVFTGEKGDYHRTRLTHTLEVASVASTLGRVLRLNEDLIEALALAHDIGHPPFGHSGEDVLDQCLAGEGGFNHNRQALRIVELLEHRYPEFPGLNLTAEVLAGQQHRTEKSSGATPPLEVQVVDAADSVAYDTHDVDDALELGLLQLEQLLEVPLWREAAQRVVARHGHLQGIVLRRAVLHELIDWLVSDLLHCSQSELEKSQPATPAETKSLGVAVFPSPDLAAKKSELEKFLYDRVYRHPTVMKERRQAQSALQRMFERIAAQPKRLPERFRIVADQAGVARATCDYLATMTDRFALQKYEELFG